MLRVYFYHTQNLQQVVPDFKKGEFPGHLLYGATCLNKYGINVLWHKSLISTSRFRQNIHSLIEVYKHYCSFDVIYATRSQGIDILVLLRALHLFRKPIVIWHHQPITTSPSQSRELLGRLFYNGYDEMFFFSKKLLDDSLRSPKARLNRMHIAHWGADLTFYDRILESPIKRCGFISTGKELRDMPTLVKAFNKVGAHLDIYLGRNTGGVNYEALFSNCKCEDNIQVHFVEGLIPYKLSLLVNQYSCVVICCQETNYTVGLTTLVEALALGIPVICSRNPQIPIDIDKERCGIFVDYYDVEGWVKAITYIVEHPDEAVMMGRQGRQLAEKMYNMEGCAAEVAEVLSKYMK